MGLLEYLSEFLFCLAAREDQCRGLPGPF